MATSARKHHVHPKDGAGHAVVLQTTQRCALHSLLQRIRPDSIRVANAEMGKGGGGGRAEYRKNTSLSLGGTGAGRLARGFMLDSRTAHPQDDEGATKNCVEKKTPAVAGSRSWSSAAAPAQDDTPFGVSWLVCHFGLTAEALCTWRHPACEACSGKSGDGGGTPLTAVVQ